MSATVTENPITYTLRQTLGDYEVHVTGDESSGEINTSTNTDNTNQGDGNPSSWPVDHHRIPSYRPINRDLSWSERPNGSNGFERVFITLMFTGVALNATAAQVWGATGGRVFKKVFRYAIGGEW